MYLRFAVAERHPVSLWWKGLFVAIADLEDSGTLTESEQDQVSHLLDWFNEVLPIPSCFRRPGSRRGICWFRPDEGVLVTRMWRLVAVLEENGKVVRLYKTADPGMPIYRDEFQVVAVPQIQQRLRVTR